MYSRIDQLTNRLICRLQNKVIDLEVAASTPSPTIDPSVRTILIGHSMGGIVAADTLLAITSEPAIKTAASSKIPTSRPPTPSPFMFPYIQGILAFDTPYLGISPGVVAYGAESHYKTATTAYSALSEVAGAFGWGAATSSNASKPTQQKKAITAGPEAAKEAMAASMTTRSTDAAATPAWQRFGKVAMFAGAAGALAAGGAAAYLKKDSLTEGWNWVGSHLEFVGCLMRGEELKARLNGLSKLRSTKQIGFADLVTVLGKAGQRQGKTFAGGLIETGGVDAEDKRMFCSMPKTRELQSLFEGMINEKASDETVAHTTMFAPRENPGYYRLSHRAKDLIVEWVEKGWYESSESIDKKGRELGRSCVGDDEEPVLVD